MPPGEPALGFRTRPGHRIAFTVNGATWATRGEARFHRTDLRDESVRITSVIKAHAEARRSDAGAIAVGWVLNNRLVTTVVAGPRTPVQWRSCLEALDRPFTAEDEAPVEGPGTTGHPSTPGYVDPDFPPVGRVPRTMSAKVATAG